MQSLPPANDSTQPPAGPPRVIIDRRPLPIVVLSRFRGQFWAVVLVGFFAVALGLAPPEGLTPAGWRSLCLFALCVVFWVTQLLPLPMTGLLAIGLIPLLGILPASQAYGYFGSRAVFFILGAFILGAAIVASGLSARLTLWALRRFGRSPRTLVGAVYGTCALASCVMSAHAVAAMVYPLAWDVARSLRLRPRHSPLGKALFYALAWGCITGGTATVLGGARAPLAIGILEETLPGHPSIDFARYTALALPLVVGLALGGWVLLRRLLPADGVDMTPARRLVEERAHDLGRVRLREVLTGAVVVATIVAWAWRGDSWGMASIALMSTAVLFVLGLVSWKEVEQHVHWGVFLLYGGAITLGSAMAHTGAAGWAADHLLGGWRHDPRALLVAVGALTAVLTEFMSNSAVVATLMPVVLSLAQQHGLDPRLATMAVVLPSSLAFALPMGTPATAVAWSSGFLPARQAVRLGLALDVVGVALLAVLVYGYWPLLRSVGLLP